jgi:tubulin-specific chaperone D
MEKYQEQSVVLDTVLDKIVSPILRYFQAFLRVNR